MSEKLFFDFMPDHVPSAVKIFILVLIVMHILAVVVWVVLCARSMRGGTTAKTYIKENFNKQD
jgi:flagellar basal body-associated protein FliL